jgi:hypothetical protein
MYLWKNIPIANGKELSPTTDKLCAEHFNGMVEKNEN